MYSTRAGATVQCISLSLAAIDLIMPTLFHLTADSRSPWRLEPAGRAEALARHRRRHVLTYFCVLGFLSCDP